MNWVNVVAVIGLVIICLGLFGMINLWVTGVLDRVKKLEKENALIKKNIIALDQQRAQIKGALLKTRQIVKAELTKLHQRCDTSWSEYDERCDELNQGIEDAKYWQEATTNKVLADFKALAELKERIVNHENRLQVHKKALGELGADHIHLEQMACRRLTALEEGQGVES